MNPHLAISMKILKSPMWYYGAILNFKKDIKELEIKPGQQLELNL